MRKCSETDEDRAEIFSVSCDRCLIRPVVPSESGMRRMFDIAILMKDNELLIDGIKRKQNLEGHIDQCVYAEMRRKLGFRDDGPYIRINEEPVTMT